MIIAVDCGTTNMRCRLYDGRKLIYETKRKAGVRNTAFDGNSNFLHDSLKSCIEDILNKNSLSESDIEIILASGTLASDVGIYHGTSHAVCPAGVGESARQARYETLADITSIPILFIPGVKTLPEANETDESRKIEIADSMSGEECEIYGIIEALGISEDFLCILPGSYLKCMEVNAGGQIESIKTGMCGEFIAAISEHTMLKKSLPSPVLKEIIKEKLIFGFEYCKTHGVSPSLIKTRNAILHLGMEQNEAANFFIGAILYDDILTCAKLCINGKKVIIGGSEPLRSVFGILLEHVGVTNIVILDSELSVLAPNYGAMCVYEEFKRINS